MNLEEHTKLYLIKNNIPLISSKRYKKDVVLTIIKGRNAAGWSPQGSDKFIKKWFPNKPKNIKLKSYILQLTNSKYCVKCNFVKPKNKFPISNSYELYCKKCKRDYNKIHYIENSFKYKANAINRKEKIKERTPSWANQNAINFFYECCPKDCHVDHTIPLQGKNISGLHIETNLQWLPATENLKKGNKWE
jgi:hypothetical protein